MRKSSFVVALAIACLLSAAYAQAPVPKEVTDIIAQTERDTGAARFGATLLGELDDGERGTVQVPVASGKHTFVYVSGDDHTLDMAGRALSGTKEVSRDEAASSLILQIPPGNGDTIRLELTLGCEEMSCRYFVQAFTR